MSKYVYAAIGLVGGTPGYLDAIDGEILTEGEGAVVFQNSNVHFYYLEEESSEVTNPPYVIPPASNALTKRWVMKGSMSAATTVDTSLFSKLLSSDENNVQAIADLLDDCFDESTFTVTNGNIIVKDVSFDSSSFSGLFSSDTTSIQQIIQILDGMHNTDDFVVAENTVSIKKIIPTQVSTNYQMLNTDKFIIVTASPSTDITITLCDCASTDQIKIIRKDDAYTTKINIVPQNAGQTIEGLSSISLDFAYAGVSLFSDNTNTWFRL